MDKPVIELEPGIPEYTEDDLLRGQELHKFCAEFVVKTMRDRMGYEIEGIVDGTPVQVIAKKDGMRYAVMVAGNVYPEFGTASFFFKKRFSDFYKANGTVPMFAPVSIMPNDPARMKARLALKNDSYYCNYTGNTDLTDPVPPDKEDGSYEAYCTELVTKAYEEGDFSPLYPLFSEDAELHSAWVMEPLTGKKNLIAYYDGKGKTLREGGSGIRGQVMKITDPMKTVRNASNQRIGVLSRPGTPCSLMVQESPEGKKTWVLVMPKFTEDKMIRGLSITMPDLFSFEPYYDYS